MPRFEFKDEKSNKFWEIKLIGSKLNVCFGKIGTQGQTQDKFFESTAKAKLEYEKLVKEKLRKGYSEVAGATRSQSSKKTERVEAKKQTKSAPRKAAVDRENFPKVMKAFLSKVGVDPKSYGDDCALFEIAAPKAGSGFKSSPGKTSQMVKIWGSQFSPLLNFSIEIPKGHRISCEKDRTSASIQIYSVNKYGALTNTLLVISAHTRKETMKEAALRKHVCQKWKIESVPNNAATPFVSAKLEDGLDAAQISLMRTFKVPSHRMKVKKVTLGGVEFYQLSSIQKKKTLSGSDTCELIGQDDTRLISLRVSTSSGNRNNLELGTKVLLTFKKTC